MVWCILNQTFAFTRRNVTSITANVPLALNENSTLEHVVQSLQTAKFQVTTVYKADLSDTVNKLLSKITFAGPGFAFALLKSKLAAQFLGGIEFVDPNLDAPYVDSDPEKVLADEKLRRMSLDFNYILGLVLGNLNLDEDSYEFNFQIGLSKTVPDVNAFNHLVIPNFKTIFGGVKNVKLTGIAISMSENLFDTDVQSDYRLDGFLDLHSKKQTYNVNTKFKFRNFGSVDFSTLVSETIDRINDITGIVVEGHE